MPALSPRDLKAQAAQRLRENGSNARSLVLLHTGAVVLLNLLSSGLSLYLDEQIGGTGGLSGLETRSLLQTIQTVLQAVVTLVSPFWSAGFVALALGWAVGRTGSKETLLEGFRRFLPVLSYELLVSLMSFFLMLATGYAAGMIFALTPFFDSLSQVLEPVLASGTMDLSLVPMEQLMDAYMPFLLMWLVILIPFGLMLYYGLRPGMYLVMGQPRMGAFRAISTSLRAMRGNRRQLLKLDLSYWWYYVLEILTMLVGYLDVLLPTLGINLPYTPMVWFFVFLILYGALELGLHLWKKPEVETAYALACTRIIQDCPMSRGIVPHESQPD